MQHYLILMEGCIEPLIVAGPLADSDSQIETAKALTRSNEYDLGEEGEDILLWLDIDDGGMPEVGSFSGGFMDEARAPMGLAAQAGACTCPSCSGRRSRG